MDARNNALLIACTVLLAGCVGSALPRGTPIERPLEPAPLPQSKVGDRVYFSNGRRERVTSVAGDRVTWRRSKHTRYTAVRDFTLPELFKQTRRRETVYRPRTLEGALWPLKIGNQSRFEMEKVVTQRADGSTKATLVNWKCEVDRAERIAVAAGRFDTYRIACQRSNSYGALKQWRYWYYAPKIGRPVLLIDEYPKRSPRRLELVAYQPSLAGLSRAARDRYAGYFQKTMESTPSGKRTQWRDARSGIRVGLEPVRTIRLADGTYCRNYLVDVDGRSGAGLACRSSTGEWRVPKRVGQ